jgi:hypothetical protein
MGATLLATVWLRSLLCTRIRYIYTRTYKNILKICFYNFLPSPLCIWV